ncbi:MAG: glycosyltransferase family 4 protein [Candidatus Hydrogenedentota bacterium]
MESPKRIAMVAYTFYDSDPRVRRHVAALVNAGYAVDLYCLVPRNGDNEGANEQVRIFHLQERTYDRSGKLAIILDYVKFAFRCAGRLLKNHLGGAKYALIHINNMPNFLLLSALPLRLMGVRNLLDIHDTMPEIYQERFNVGPKQWMIRGLFFEEWVCMKLAGFVITTEHTKRDRLLQNGLRQDKSAVTLNLPDPALFPWTPLPDDPPPKGETFRLVYHGALARRLGIDVAIQAVAKLGDCIPELRFDIIGDGEFRSELVELTEQLNVAHRVRFSDGFVPTVQLPEMLKGASLGIVPSRNSIATQLMLPTKLLEYVWLGIPVITVPTPTIRRYFQESMVRFVAPEDPQALAEAITRLYEQPAERLAIARAARQFFEQYSFESERERYLSIVDTLAR